MTENGSIFQMEAGEVEIGGVYDQIIGTYYELATPATPLGQDEHFGTPRYEPIVESSAKKRKVNPSNQDSQVKDGPSVSNCFLFKSRLQEFSQKAGFTSPVYETIKEGRSHEPSFKSTVIVNNVRYDSLPGFFNRKTAEQSAAEVALMKLSNSADMEFGISQPVHETGLCKNLLQEYAQKMNYAIPLYECLKEERQGKTPMYSCTVEVGGIKYIGASANTKKEAEIKAARTALISLSENQTSSNSVYTVVPQKKKASDHGIAAQEVPTPAVKKPKKRSLKKKMQQQQWKKKRRALKRGTSGQEGTTRSAVNKADSVSLAGVASGDVGPVTPHHRDDVSPQVMTGGAVSGAVGAATPHHHDDVGPQVMTGGAVSVAVGAATPHHHDDVEPQVMTGGAVSDAVGAMTPHYHDNVGPQVMTGGGSDNVNRENTSPFDGGVKEGGSATMDANNNMI
ncbi:hypothetical protein ACP275_04G216800 [Erythranthe tilingii]